MWLLGAHEGKVSEQKESAGDGAGGTNGSSRAAQEGKQELSQRSKSVDEKKSGTDSHVCWREERMERVVEVGRSPSLASPTRGGSVRAREANRSEGGDVMTRRQHDDSRHLILAERKIVLLFLAFVFDTTHDREDNFLPPVPRSLSNCTHPRCSRPSTLLHVLRLKPSLGLDALNLVQDRLVGFCCRVGRPRA